MPQRPAAAPTHCHRLHPGEPVCCNRMRAMVVWPVGKRKGHGRPRRRTRPCDTCKGMRSYEGFPSVMRAMHAAFAVHGDACLGGVRSHRRKRRVRRGDDPLLRQRRLGEAVRVHVRRWCALRVLAGRTDGGRRRRLVQRYRECAAWIARAVQRQRKIAAPRNKPTGVRGQWRSLVRGKHAVRLHAGGREGALLRLREMGQGPPVLLFRSGQGADVAGRGHACGRRRMVYRDYLRNAIRSRAVQRRRLETDSGKRSGRPSSNGRGVVPQRRMDRHETRQRARHVP